MEPGTVAVAYLHTGTVHHGWMESLIGTIMHDMKNGGALRSLIAVSDPYIPSGRCEAVRRFLAAEEEWLWFLDYDIIFEPDVVHRMLEVADPVERPIVAALYLAHFYEAFRPCWLMVDGSVISVAEYTEKRGDESQWPMELRGCGMGCTLIHRSVLEKLAEEYSEDPWPFFGHDIVQKKTGEIERFGEDFTFCFRAHKHGARIWGVPIELGHMKVQNIHPSSYRDPVPITTD